MKYINKMELSELPKSEKPQTDNLPDYNNLEYADDETGLGKLLQNDEGYIVGRINNRLLRHRTDSHMLTISPTGGGKTSGMIIPNLLDHQGSSFVVDIRGETVAKTADIKRLQGHKVVVMDPYDLTKGDYGHNTYNPLQRIVDNLEAQDFDELVGSLTEAFLFDEKDRQSKEPIWDNSTIELIAGLITYVIKYRPNHQHNLYEIKDILLYTSDELEIFIGEIIHLIRENEEASNDDAIKALLKILTEGKSTTKITDNALIQALVLFKWVRSKAFKNELDHSTFSFSEMQEKPMVVYLVIPENHIKSCAIWVRIMFESAVFSMKEIYGSLNKHTSELGQDERVLFLLDETPAFGPLDVISGGINTLRGRGINLWLFIQNLAQLEDIYGDPKSRTIIGNTSLKQFFHNSEVKELEYMVKLIGEEFVDVKTVTIGRGNTDTVSHGQSHGKTITNSASQSHASGTTDSVQENYGINWQNGFGTNTNWSENFQQSVSGSKGITENTGRGRNKNRSESPERNMLPTTARGTNSYRGKAKNRNSGWQKSSGQARGGGENYTQNEGGQHGIAKARSVMHQDTYTHQNSEADNWVDNHTESHGESSRIDIGVKQERLSIETIRSIREKLNEENQLLVVGMKHPFFTPKMAYFKKFYNNDTYMFPDMAALVDHKVFRKMCLDGISYLGRDTESSVKIKIELLKQKLNTLKTEISKGTSFDPLLKKFNNFINVDIREFISEYEGFILKSNEMDAELDMILVAFVGFVQLFVQHLENFERSDIEEIARLRKDIKSPMKLECISKKSFKKLKNIHIRKFVKEDRKHIVDIHDEDPVTDEDKLWSLKYGIESLECFLKELENDVDLIFKKENSSKALGQKMKSFKDDLNTNWKVAVERAIRGQMEV